ncbi:MAG: permease-like cell division protein FtsX [Pseudomonadota bacterium]
MNPLDPGRNDELLKTAPEAPRRRAGGWMANYAQRHLQVLLSCFGQLARAPLSHLITVLVIAIALSLPAGLYVAGDNLRQLAAGWEDQARISLFLKRSLSESAITSLAEELRRREGVARVDYVSAQRGLEEFRAYSGFEAVLDLLNENPLPPVLVVHPQDSSPAGTERLFSRIKDLPGVEQAQLDLEWLQRLHGILVLVERGGQVIAVILGLAVLMIVGNTVRVGIQQRRDEIVVSKLVGATHGFIRRPFLYLGMLQGLLGGILAWLLVMVSLALLAGPVDRLAALYQSAFILTGLGFQGSLALLGAGAALGWLGALLTVGYYLREVEPR